ncbi:hypothetical protein GCM10020001_088740 [Nonomuraea salmonea]
MRPNTTAAKAEMFTPMSTYEPKNAKKIISSSGTDLKNSTTTAAGTRTHVCSDSRAVAKTSPNSPASTTPTTAADSVPASPGRMNVAHTSARSSGVHFSAAHWSLASNRTYTKAATASSASATTPVSTRLRRTPRGPGVS